MKKITVLLLFLTTTAFCQKTEKKEYFYDEEKRPVTQKVFLERDKLPGLFAHYEENDSIKIGKLFFSENVGKVDFENLTKIKDYLKKISGRKIDTTQVIVINFYHGTDKKGRGFNKINDEDYTTQLQELGNIAQFWVYKDEKNLTHYYSRNSKWLHDKEKIIEKLFFPTDFLYGSFVVIHPKGNCEVHYAEYSVNRVLQSVEKIIKYNGN